MAERKVVRRFQGHRDEVICVSFLPDDATLVSGGKDGSVRLWNLSTTNNNTRHNVLPERVRSVPAFATNGQSFIAACRDGFVRRWDARSLRELERLSFLGFDLLAVDLSPDGRWLAAAEASGNLVVWDWSSRRVVTNLAFTPTDSAALSFGARSGFLLVNTQGWETVTWAPLPAPPDFQRQQIRCVSIAPNEREWASGHWDGRVRLYTFPSSELLIEFSGHIERVNALAFASAGHLLASVGADGYVNLYDVPARRLLRRFRAHYNSASGVCFSPDARRLATFGNTRDSSKLWDLATFRPLISLPWMNHWGQLVKFSPDGDTLMRLNAHGIVDLWHAPSFAELEAAERSQAPPRPQP